MNNFNEYQFIYADMDYNWQTCTNPIFIAKHKLCRAIQEKINIKELIILLNKNKVNIINDPYGLYLDNLIENFTKKG
jgi:hypothetical protein